MDASPLDPCVCTRPLTLGVKINFRCVSGHAGIVGNEKADTAGKLENEAATNEDNSTLSRVTPNTNMKSYKKRMAEQMALSKPRR